MLDKLPPQALEAEESLLSAMMMDNGTINDVAGILKPIDFYKTSHQLICTAILDLHEKGQAADLITIQNHLREKKQLKQMGGATYLAKLRDEIPMAVNAPHYSKIVKNKAVKRAIISAANKLATEALQDSKSIDELINEAQSAIFNLDSTSRESHSAMLCDIIPESIDRLEMLQNKDTRTTGVPTGIKGVDEITGGYQKSDLIVVAARPGVGKSAYALNTADNVVISGGSVAIFSLEMSRQQLGNRLLARHAQLNSARFRSGGFSDGEWDRLNDAAQKLYNKKLIIDDSCDLHYQDVRRAARRYKKEHNIDLIIIDYLQLLRGNQDRGGNRVQEVSTISRNLKQMAKELNIPVLALSQLNRSLEQRDDKRPRLSDLRESGSIEQDADIVAFLYRDIMYRTKDKSGNPVDEKAAELDFKKHRNGMTGMVQLEFVKELTLFCDSSN